MSGDTTLRRSSYFPLQCLHYRTVTFTPLNGALRLDAKQLYADSFYALYKLRSCNFYSDIRFAICGSDGETSPWMAWPTTPTLPGDMWPPSFQSRVLRSTYSNMDHVPMHQ